MGRGGKGRGRGKGGGRKRKQGGWRDASDDEGGKANGKGKGKGKKGKLAAESEKVAAPPPPEEPVRKVARKPDFGALLSSFGAAAAAASESDDDSNGAADESQDEQPGDQPQDGGEGEGEEEEEEIEEEGEEEELEPEPEIESDDEGEEEAEVDADANGSSLPDFYSHFWAEPQEAARTAGGPFELPGLAACRARGCRVDQLRSLVTGTAAEASLAWRRCGLAPGLYEAFGEHLAREGIELGAAEGALFAAMHGYVDTAFPMHSHENGRAVRAAYMLHVVDHLLKATAETQKNTFKVGKLKRSGASDGAFADGAPAAQDSGFTRARALVLCPTKASCQELLRTLLALCPSKKEIANKSRFDDEFGPGEDDAVDTRKPPDWSYVFAGNDDDSFRIGVSVSRKQIRLYAPFDKSDLLICSPLGLRKITGAEGDKKREFDFLSSIEVCVVDRLDVLKMQNLEHLMEVLKVVNCRPQTLSSVDISRLRPAFADGRARAFRQSIVTSAGSSLDMEAVFTLGASAGPVAAPKKGSLAQRFGLGKKRRGGTGAADSDSEADQEEVPTQLLGTAAPSAAVAAGSCRGLVHLTGLLEGGPMQRATALGISRQFFLHVGCKSVQDQASSLFSVFESRYWKPLGSTLERLLIVAPSYLAFLTLRRFLREAGVPFSSCFEYSSNSSMSQARQQFYHGERKVLLVTERLLWYRRYKLRGADYVLFYGPPETPEIYEEVLGQTRTPSQCNCMCLYTKYDAFALARLVGSERSRKMVAADAGKVFIYS